MLNKLNPLPKWNESKHITEDGEAWKWKEELLAAEAVYNKWRELFTLVMAFAENLPDNENEALSSRTMIYENAYVIAIKILSAAGDTLYMIKMENAAIIRFNCRQMWEQIAFAVLADEADESHKRVIEETLNEFKVLFKKWVATFRKDEVEDEWGLF